MPAIRPARAADLPALVALERACFGAGAHPATALGQHLDLFGDLTFVVDGPDGGLAAAVYGGLRPAPPRDGWVLGIGVDPAHRRRGLADALLAHLCPQLDAAGAARIHATVHPDNAASRALFARHGFVETRHDEAYFGPGEPRLRLTRDRPR